MTDSRLRTGDPQARVPFVEEASEASNELARIRHEMGEVEGEERTVRAEYERVRKISVRARDTRAPPRGPVADDATEGTNAVTPQDELNNEKRKLVAEKNARASVEAKRGMLFARPDPLLRGVRMPLTPAPSLLSGAAPTSPTNPAPASPPHTHS